METGCPASASYLTPKLSYPNTPFLTVYTHIWKNYLKGRMFNVSCVSHRQTFNKLYVIYKICIIYCIIIEAAPKKQHGFY